MDRNQVIFLLAQALLLALWGVGVLGWKFLVKRVESAGEARSAQALEELRARLDRLTHATGLYVQRQHEVFPEVYRAMRFARDQLVDSTQMPPFQHDLLGLTADEMDAHLEQQGGREPLRRQVRAEWRADEESRRNALMLVQSELPQSYRDTASDHITKATNVYLGNRLYFSDAGIAAMETTLAGLRRAAAAIQYGVRPPDLDVWQAELDQVLERAHSRLREELKQPGA
jgi:hypothetical protein